MSRYAQIRKTDISDGPGIRVAIYFQGCSIHCPGCHNQSIWDFESGIEFTDHTISTLIKLADHDHIAGLSILGGEPLADQNIEATLKLISEFKKAYPTKTVWLWTGYKFEDVYDRIHESELDVIVDGPFMLDKKDLRLKYCGSLNQRVIDFKKSTKSGIKLYNTSL